MNHFLKTLLFSLFLALPTFASDVAVIINDKGDMKWLDEMGKVTASFDAFKDRSVIDLIKAPQGFFATYANDDEQDQIIFISARKQEIYTQDIPYTSEKLENLGGLALSQEKGQTILHIGGYNHIKRMSISYGEKGVIQRELKPIYLQTDGVYFNILPSRLQVVDGVYHIVDHAYNFHTFDPVQKIHTMRPQIDDAENDFMALWVDKYMISAVDAGHTALFMSKTLEDYLKNRFAPKNALKQDIRFHHMDVADRPNIQFDLIDGVHISAMTTGSDGLLWLASRFKDKTWLRAYNLHETAQHGPTLKIADEVVALCPLGAEAFKTQTKKVGSTLEG